MSEIYFENVINAANGVAVDPFFPPPPPPQVILIEIRSFYLLSGNNKQQWKRMPVFNKVTLEEIFIF